MRSISSSTNLLLLAALLLAGCAKQGYPSGGPRDAEPPKAVGCKPVNETRGFNGNRFFAEFDEYVVLKDAANNVLISPPLKGKPEYVTKGKGVQVTWTDTLLPNTTYLFQFKDAIADFTEGNLLPSFEYVFSTGDGMDTMTLAGRVADARGGKPWKNTLTVMAYRTEHCQSDTMATSTQPDFVTRTDKEGRFAFHYIPAGGYRLVALDDANRDLRVAASEAIAWDTAVHLAAPAVDSNAMAALRISAPDRQAQRVLKAEFTRRGRIDVVTLKPMKAPRLDGERVEWRLNARRDTLSVWCLDELCDSTVLTLHDEGLADTLRLRFAEKKGRSRGKGRQKVAEEPLVKALCAGASAYYDDLRLAFANPIVKTADSLHAEVTAVKDSAVTLCPIVMDSGGLTAHIVATLKSGEDYVIRLRDSLFADLYGHYSDSLRFALKPNDYGTLTLHVANKVNCPLVIEVLDKNDSAIVSHPLPASGNLRFDHLAAGEYRLRAVLDADSNGRWTTGDYLLGRQPEATMIYEKTLQLREKWELEERWTVGKKAERKLLEGRPTFDLPSAIGNKSILR